MFEMGAKLENEDYSIKKKKPTQKSSNEIKPPQKHSLHFAKEKRRGKVVTIVKPFYLEKDQMKETLKKLKKVLGCGGTLKDNSLEFQGEIQDKLKSKLIELGFGVR
jgi:translation initiation factor 1